MSTRIQTVFDFRGPRGAGFYNLLTIKNQHTDLEVPYGPYESRPIARLKAQELCSLMEADYEAA
jgi:hypothetical protein